MRTWWTEQKEIGSKVYASLNSKYSEAALLYTFGGLALMLFDCGGITEQNIKVF